MTISRFLALAALVLVAFACAAWVGAARAKQHRPAIEDTAGLADATLLVVRHAEKPTRDGDRGLSPAGQARAQAYADYFRHFTIDGKPVHIDALVASSDSDASARPRLTLEPLAAATGLAVQTPFSNKQVKDAARWLASGGATSQPHGTVLIAWHHGKLAKLLDALGADADTLLPGGEWPSDVYDWVIVLRYDGAGHLAQSRRIVEPADLVKAR